MELMAPNYLAMVIFLLFGACANLPFFVRSLLDCFPSSALARVLPSAPSALLTTATAELCWVLPCLVQCSIQLFNGQGPWSPSKETAGCDLMGFYSVFASLSGMTSTLWVAFLTWRAARHQQVSANVSMLVGVSILAGAALVTSLPFMGVGSFKFTGEGFCYWDWHHAALSSVMLVITLPCILGTLALLLLAMRAGGWPSQLDLQLMLIAFLSAWALWVPASLIGLAGGDFPRGYMISGGVMGHAQALINPYIYGVRWRRSALLLTSEGKGITVSPMVSPEPKVTPSQANVLEAPSSAPPSPPGSQVV